MAKQCGSCEYENTDVANFCGKCGLPFGDYSLAKVETRLASPYEASSAKGWVDRAIQTYYELAESTQKDYVTWEIFGKHIAAHRARVKGKEFAERFIKISEDGLERLARQKVDATLQIERAKVEAHLKQQKLAEDMKLFKNAMVELKKQLEEHPFSDLNEETKAQLAERLFDELLYRVFGHPNGATVVSSSFDVINSR